MLLEGARRIGKSTIVEEFAKQEYDDYLIKKYQLKMEDRYVIYTKDLKCEDGITYIPVYMTMFI